MRLPDGTQSLTDLSSRFEPEILGSRREIKQLLEKIGVEWVGFDPRAVGLLRSPAFVLEIELPVGPLDHVVLALHGEQAAEAAAKVVEVLGASAIDMETDQVVEADAPSSRRQAALALDLACTA